VASAAVRALDGRAPHRLLLLRHGESSWNEQGLFTGWVDVGLTDRGASEAVRLVLSPRAGMTSAGALWGGVKLARAAGVVLRYPYAIAASLALLQRPDGGLGARHRAISTLRDTWLGLQAARVLEELQEE
jgi:hypothetical protein